jgi:hypothetical protein
MMETISITFQNGKCLRPGSGSDMLVAGQAEGPDAMTAGGRGKAGGRAAARAGRDGPDELFWLLVVVVCGLLVGLRRAWPGMRDQGTEWWDRWSGPVLTWIVVLLLVTAAMLGAWIAVGRRRRRRQLFPDATGAAAPDVDGGASLPPLPQSVPPFRDLPVAGVGGAPVLRYGVARGGEVQGWELGGPDAHCLVVGPPGSGKTNLLLAMAVEATRQGVEVLVVDPRRLGLVGLRGRPGVSWVATEVAHMVELLSAVHAEMERRYRLIEARKTGLDRRRDGAPAPLLVVVDDLAFLEDRIDADDGLRRPEGDARPSRPMALLRELAVMGGATDLHLLVSALRPDDDVVAPSMRAALGHRVALNGLSAERALLLWGSADIGRDVSNNPGRAVASNRFGPREVQCVVMPEFSQWPSLITPLPSTNVAGPSIDPPALPADRPLPRRTIPRE